MAEQQPKDNLSNKSIDIEGVDDMISPNG